MKNVPFRDVLDNLPIALYVTDAGGRLTYFNAAAVEFSGRVPELGTDKWCVTWKLYNPDGTPLPHDKCPMAVALKEGRPIIGKEAIAERPDGKRLWFAPYPIPLFDSEGNLTGGINMLVDITKRKTQENSDAFLGAIIEGSDDAIISKNLDGYITSWNKSAERIFGYTEKETIGQPITILIPDDRLDEETVILSELRKGNRVEHFETIRERKDGTKLNISLTISPIRNPKGEIIGASKIARDITARKQAEAKLKALNNTLESRVEERTASLISYQEQLKSLTSKLSKAEESERQHLATVLHDNLGQILAMSKMKLDGILSYRLPDKIHSKALEMAELMSSAITFTRELMTDLKPPPSLEKESLKANIEWLANKMEKHGLQVTVAEDNQPAPVSEEVRRTICQCTRELFFNIIKHAKVNEARVNITHRGNQIQVEIEDKGRGFGLGEGRPSPTEEGGFGLFNIYERMEWLGGSMEIDSAPGKGTKVKLIVPLNDEGTSTPDTSLNKQSQKESSDSVPENETRVKVLLADDHQMVRKGLKNLIEEQEDLVVVAEAINGREAVSQTGEVGPDVIVMDINMPLMDGIRATKIISSTNPEVRIIGLSLHDKEEVVNAMRNAGASAYLTKTEAFESLTACIRSEAQAAKVIK